MPHDPKTGQHDVVIDRVASVPDGLFIWAHGDEADSDPEASGFLRPIDGSAWISVDRVRRLGDANFELVAFDRSRVPTIGSRYWLQYAWTSDVLPALRDSTWRPTVIDARWFCPVTYRNLEEGEAAYVNEEGLEISVAAWEDYVRDDKLRFRSFSWPTDIQQR